MIPLIRPEQISVRQVPQLREESQMGIHRYRAGLALHAEARVCDLVLRHMRTDVENRVSRLLRTQIMRKMYPVEIRTEFSRLEESIARCRSLRSYEVVDLLTQVAELRKQLCPA